MVRNVNFILSISEATGGFPSLEMKSYELYIQKIMLTNVLLNREGMKGSKSGSRWGGRVIQT